MMPAAMGEKWIRDVLAFDPFSGDMGDPGDRELRDKIVKARRSGVCHCCGDAYAAGTLVRSIVMVYAADGLKAFKFCKWCCDAQAISWTDGGAAIDRCHAKRRGS